MLHFIIIVSLVYSTNTASAPFITKCKAEDSDCLKQAAQAALPILVAGLPEFGVKVLDPIFLRRLNASSAGLHLKIENVTGIGLKDCVFKKVQRDVLESTLTLKALCTGDFHGKYEMDGHLLVASIKGKGDAHVHLKNVLFTLNCNLSESVASDGQKHWVIKQYQYMYDLQDKSTIELENLFSGNEVIGRAARALIDSNSNEIIHEFGSPILKALLKIVVENTNNFFKNVPISELTLD